MATTHAPELNSGIYTSWLPLATQGPPLDPACSSSIYIRPYLSAPEVVAFDPWYGSVVDVGLTCAPSQVTSWWFGQSTLTQSLVSLGPFVCPSGYATGATSSLNTLSTLVGCCPSSYTFQGFTNIGPGQCISPLTSGQVFTAKRLGTSQWVDTTSTMTTASTIVGAQVNGYMFAAIPTSTTTSPIPTITPTSAPIAGTAAAPATSTTISPSSSSSIFASSTSTKPSSTTSQAAATSTTDVGLSKGAKAGIGIGVTIGIIGIAWVVAGIFWRRRQDSRSTKSASSRESYREHLPKPDIASLVAAVFMRLKGMLPAKSESKGRDERYNQVPVVEPPGQLPIYEALAKSRKPIGQVEPREVSAET